MADEEKDEQVIVIEDLEEEGEAEDLGGEGKEEAPEEEPQGQEPKEEPEEEEPLKAPPSRGRKKLFFIALGAFVLILSGLILYFALQRKPHKKVEHPQKTQTHKVVKKKKKKAIEHKAHVAKVEKKRTEKRKAQEKPQAYNPSIDVHFINALRLQEKGEYVAAINELKQASLDLYLSYFNIGYLYLKMGQVKKAKEYLIDKTRDYLLLTIENNPNYLQAYVNLFKVYMAAGDYKHAKRIIDFLSKKPLPADELELMKSYYAYVVNDNATAIELAFKKFPSSALLNALMGELYLKKGKIEDALISFGRALRMYDMGGVYYDDMLAYVKKGDYGKAMDAIPHTYYMQFSKISCKNYLSFFVLLHQNKFQAAYRFLKLNRRFYPECFKKFKIVPISVSSIGTFDLIVRRNVPYMLAAEIMNMYLKPIKFQNRGTPGSIKIGKLYESLGLPSKAVDVYSKTADFAEAVLLSERAVKFYVAGQLKYALDYYKRASKKLNDSDPILLYDIAVMEMKLHRLKKALPLLMRLNNAYPNFPLPYFGMFIVKELNAHHREAMQELSDFIVRLKSLNSSNLDMKELGVIADLIANGTEDRLDGFPAQTKRLFLIVKAALHDDLAFLEIEKPFEKMLGLKIERFSNLNILKYLVKYYPTDFIRRTLSDYYLIKKDYENAYRALFGIPVYNAVDYYKFGIAYLLDGYPEVADNFFTKSILNGVGFYNAYVAKEIIQAMKQDYHGVLYYLKIILKKQRAWLDTDVTLSFRIEFENPSVTQTKSGVLDNRSIGR